MKASEIVVGGKYSNTSTKSAGIRIVDSISERINERNAMLDNGMGFTAWCRGSC